MPNRAFFSQEKCIANFDGACGSRGFRLLCFRGRRGDPSSPLPTRASMCAEGFACKCAADRRECGRDACDLYSCSYLYFVGLTFVGEPACGSEEPTRRELFADLQTVVEGIGDNSPAWLRGMCPECRL